MSKSRKNEPGFPEHVKPDVFDAILGPVDEIGEAAAANILETYGITGESLVTALKARLQERIRQVRDETGEIPAALEAILKNVREYQKENIPRPSTAAKWVEDMFLESFMPKSHTQLLYNFRNRGAAGISESDKKILDNMKSELEDMEE